MTTALARLAAFPTISDWEVAYSNRIAIPDFPVWLGEATKKAAAFVAGWTGEKQLGFAYGPDARHIVDTFTPANPKGTLIFIHGGYWRATSTADHHHFAQGALARGWRVAFPEYPLCPGVRIGDIAAATATAIEAIARQFPQGPLVITGHSAGGHLATHAASTASLLTAKTRARIIRVVSLSGLHDLRPLVRAHQLNALLRLTDNEATRLSPALLEPGKGFDLHCVCGGGELPEFRRQNALLANVWSGFGVSSDIHEAGNLDHFRLLDKIVSPDDDLTRLLTPDL